jgi:hypothetical protein
MLDKAHFDRQLDDAQVLSSRQNISLEQALLKHTDFYMRFGLGQQPDPGNQDWRYFFRGLKFATDPKDWIFRFYQSCAFVPNQFGPPTEKVILEKSALMSSIGEVALPDWTKELRDIGYEKMRLVGGLICAIKRFNFTTAVVVGLEATSYDRRYCFEHESDASQALADWCGDGHLSGPWIKCKGAQIDILNPNLGHF